MYYDVLLASRAKASILKNNPLDVRRMLHTVPTRMLETGTMQILSKGAIWKSGKMQTTTFYRLENGVCSAHPSGFATKCKGIGGAGEWEIYAARKKDREYIFSFFPKKCIPLR